jgi:hypothetical protein
MDFLFSEKIMLQREIDGIIGLQACKQKLS